MSTLGAVPEIAHESTTITQTVRTYQVVLYKVVLILLVAVILTPAILGYAFGWTISSSSTAGVIGVSVYGLYSMAHFAMQVVFSYLDRRSTRLSRLERPLDWHDIKASVVIAGFREEPFLFKKCLESIKNIKYQNMGRIICVVDGNTAEDSYMGEIFREVFGDNVVSVDYVMSEDRKQCNNLSGASSLPICVLQPHRGKREALFTAFTIAMSDPTVHAIVTTDSDTMLTEDAVLELVYPLSNDEKVGAVAGDIKIWNNDSLLSALIAFRYCLAFNVERSAQSYWRTVLCVGGPLGGYRVSVLREVIDSWIDQRFLGNKCSYGDDRHLTNRVLMHGSKVVYTPHSVCWTDTPYSYRKYLVQQTRWSKSFNREYFYTMGCINKHPLWMTYEPSLQMVYTYLLTYWVIHLLFFTNLRTQLLAVMATTAMTLLKSGYGMVLTGDWTFFFFHMYSYIYYFVIIPAKYTALFRMMDISWGTRGNSAANKFLEIVKTYAVQVVWAGMTIYGGVRALLGNMHLNFTDDTFLLTTCVVYLAFMVLSFASFHVLKVFKLIQVPMFFKLEEDKRALTNISAQ